jgi:multimeric flavodoxin WrbA
MKVLLLNGNPEAGNGEFDAGLALVGKALAGRGDAVVEIRVRDCKIEQCIGCYSCWLRTPGRCVLNDDMPRVYAAYAAADAAVFASPLVMGNIGSGLKAVQERLIATILPFLRIEGDRMRHPPRYGRTPAVGLLLGRNEDPEAAAIAAGIFCGMGREKSFVTSLDAGTEGVLNALDRI